MQVRLAVLALALLSLAGCGSTVTARTVPCPTYSFGAVPVCYAPRDVGIAEGQLRRRPVDPTAAVTHLAHLTPYRVVLWHPGLQEIGRLSPPTAIEYIYLRGSLPRRWHGLLPSSPLPPQPPLIVLTESPPLRVQARGRLADLVHADTAAPVTDWELSDGNLEISDNLSRSLTAALAHAIPRGLGH